MAWSRYQDAASAQLAVTAHEFRFAPAEVRAQPGQRVVVTLTNADTTLHDWVIEGVPNAHVTAAAGRTLAASFTAPRRRAPMPSRAASRGTKRPACGHAARGVGGVVSRTELADWVARRAQQDDVLYGRYGRPLEAEHAGEFVAISQGGEVVLGTDELAVAKETASRIEPGHSYSGAWGPTPKYGGVGRAGD